MTKKNNFSTGSAIPGNILLDTWISELEGLVAANGVDNAVFHKVVDEQLKRCYALELNLATSSMFFLFDNVLMKYRFVSTTVEQVLGYTREEVINNGFEWIFTLMTESELQYKNELMADIYGFLSTQSPELIRQLIVRYDIVGRTKEGEYRHYMEELMFPEVSDVSIPLLTSCFIHELGDFGNRAMRTCIIFNPYSGSASQPLFRKKYPQLRKSLLSRRELEVLSCFARGMSTEEASRHLHVSSNTIKTHRKNILFKLDAKNTTEALKISLSEHML